MTTPQRRRRVLAVSAFITGAAVAISNLSGCANSEPTTAAPAATKMAGAACVPAVMVVRHGEDKANPAGGADILNDAGKRHAALYGPAFAAYLSEPHSLGADGAEADVCPIGRVIAIDPNKNSANRSPGSNPYQTIKPLADSLQLPVQIQDSAGTSYSTIYVWNAARLKDVLPEGGQQSTVIAWDKQGLNPSITGSDSADANKTITSASGEVVKLGTFYAANPPLLKAFPVDPGSYAPARDGQVPQRMHFFVFAQQDPATGRFAVAKAYRQGYTDQPGGAVLFADSLPTASAASVQLDAAKIR